MKTLIAILIIASFLQNTILPVNLVLIVLICRSLVRVDKTNLYLAFGFGLLNSYLSVTVLGLESLLFLGIVQAVQMLSRSRFASSAFLIIPLCIFFLSLNYLVLSLTTHNSVVLFPRILWEGLISLPIYYLIKLWEERFVVRKELKLKV